jgi:hypothetical protein
VVCEVLWEAGGKRLMAKRPLAGDAYTYVHHFKGRQLQAAFPAQCYPATREGVTRLLAAMKAAVAVPAEGTRRERD